MGGGRNRLVRIPADSPFSEEPGSHVCVDDLNLRRWFPRGSQRIRLSSLPADRSFVLRNDYSVITSRCRTATAINRTILDNWGLTVRGHVLVVRHATRNFMRITNILHNERRLIDWMVRRYVRALSYEVIHY